MVVVVLVLWRSGTTAEARLASARTALTQLRAAAVSGDAKLAAQRLHEVQVDCAAATSATSGPIWAVAASLPYAGRTPRAVRQIADAADALAHRTLPELVQAVRAIQDDGMVRAGGGIDLDRLGRVATILDRADATIGPIRAQLRALPSALVVGRVRRAGEQLRTELAGLQTGLDDAAATARVLPSMLGADGPRRYFLALQNNAEARGTGGLVGAYSIVVADAGRLRVIRTGSVEQLVAMMPAGKPLPRSVDASFTALYGGDPALWQNSNMSPHFPYAAALWLRLWQRSTGQQLDGAVAVDPLAAGYLLRVTGPARLPDGESIDAGNIVVKTERDDYRRFGGNTAARKAYLGQVAQAVFGRLLSNDVRRTGLLDAIRRAVRQNRLLVYSAHPDEERALMRTAVAGALPQLAGPFLEVAVDNAGPGKLDYYLRRTVTYDLGDCRGTMRSSQVNVTLASDVPRLPLSAYVVGPTQRLLVYLYLSAGAHPTYVGVDGAPAPVFIGTERGHPVVELPVDLPPRESRAIVVRIVEPAVAGAPLVRTQPLARPQQTTVRTHAC